MKTGLCSVTFRKLDVQAVLDLVARSGLDGIEWGGDVHCPPGLGQAALKEVARATHARGLQVLSYGSYYRVLQEPDPIWQESFRATLDAACALEAPVIRIWVGGGDSALAKDEDFNRAADRMKWCGAQAAAQGIRVATEFHGGCLTDNIESTLRLMGLVAHPNVGTYWQQCATGAAITTGEFSRLRSHLSHVHIFHWSNGTRIGLAEGAARWKPFLDLLRSWKFTGALLLEFVKDDSPDQFLRDAKALSEWVRG